MDRTKVEQQLGRIDAAAEALVQGAVHAADGVIITDVVAGLVVEIRQAVNEVRGELNA